MERTNASSSEIRNDANSAPKKPEDENVPSTFQQVREIFESLAIALFLAFLFKTFEAEAFVIPTGSMAPTLKGRHKDVLCEECGYRFQTSASEEIDSSCNRRNGRYVVAGTCPQCGFTQYFGDEFPSPKRDKRAPSYSGDRILVSKLTFDQREVERWDVSVFRSPAEPKINFIKRIVGLPNENLRVQYGDLFVQSALGEQSDDSTAQDETSAKMKFAPTETAPDVNLGTLDLVGGSNSVDSKQVDNSGFEIARKDYKYLRHILQTVYDADYEPTKLDALGWPSRWSPDESTSASNRNWARKIDGKKTVFRFGADGGDAFANARALKLETEADVSPILPDDKRFSWLRYRHVVPSSTDWRFLTEGVLPPDVEKSGVVADNPRLIDDFTGYNGGIARGAERDAYSGELRWSNVPNDEFALLTKKERDAEGKERVFCAKNPDGIGCNWVGDLAVSAEIAFENLENESGRLAFDLVKGGVVFRCLVAPKLGTITLSIPSAPEFVPKELAFNFKKNKTYNFVFLNVDEEMRVAIDDRELVFPDGGGKYDALTAPENGAAIIPRNRDPNARDLAPVAIGACDLEARVEKLKVLRDVYYIAAGRALEPWDSNKYGDFGTARCDRLAKTPVYFGSEEDAARFMSTPDDWVGYGNTKSALLRQKEGQYVAFGDNSGFSLDSRLWFSNVVPHYVDKKYLIGKAFYVYWPHGMQVPILNRPIWPNFSQMRHID